MVNVALTDAERYGIFRMRYRVFVEHLGRHDLDGADHQARTVIDSLDVISRHYYMGEPGQPVAAVTVSPLHGSSLSRELSEFLDLARLAEAVPLAKAAFVNWLLVDPSEAGSNAVTTLMTAGAEDALGEGMELVLTFCRPGLVSFYERLGFEQYKHATHLKGIGLRCPLLLVLRDGARLKAMRSPLVRILRGGLGTDGPNMARLRLEPLIDLFQASQILVNDELWVESEVKFVERVRPRLFDGLQESHIRHIMKLTSVISCQPDEIITRRGETSDDMFLVAAGSFSAADAAGNTRALSEGDLFGEREHLSGLPRSETVRALTAGHVAALTAGSLFHWMKQNPAAGVTVAINLARLISRRISP